MRSGEARREPGPPDRGRGRIIPARAATRHQDMGGRIQTPGEALKIHHRYLLARRSAGRQRHGLATSLHGAQAQAWPTLRPTARFTVERLLQRWRQDGLPDYAQFDNDSIFQGTHRFADSLGRVIRLCLAPEVTPVFAPPREPGFQNAIEGFNALWQAKVWLRHHFSGIEHLQRLSRAYINAYRTKTACRAEVLLTTKNRGYLPET